MTTTFTSTKTPRTLIASGTSNAAGATTFGVLDQRVANGGQLTIKITNGATGPTAQATATVLIAHNAGATPPAAVAGTDWKTHVGPFGAGIVANAVSEFSIPIDQAIMHIEVQVTGNTGQAVTCEAYLSEITNVVGN
jgi:hypothetical protein